MPAYYSQALPVVGVTPGPTWATYLNTVLNLLENHAHTGTDEQKITVPALSIGADLPFGGNGAIGLRTARFNAAALPATGSNSYGLLVDATGQLWFENATTQVQLTTGSGIVQNGTGAFNGFYNGGGNGYAGSPPGTGGAGAYFDASLLEYRFNSTTVSPSNTNLATIASNTLDVRNDAGPSVYLRGSAKTGGVRLLANNGAGGQFQVFSDQITAGSYNLNPFNLAPTGSNNNYSTILNNAGSAGYALSLGQVGNNNNLPVDIMSIWAGSVSTPLAGFGPNLKFVASSVASAAGAPSYPSPIIQADIESYYSGTVGTSAGIRLFARNASAKPAAAGFDLRNQNGDQFAAVGGAAVNFVPLTLYPTLNLPNAGMNPSVSGTLDLGTSGTNLWRTVWAQGVNNSGGVLTLTGFGGASVVGALAVSGAATLSSTLAATNLTPTATATAPVAAAGGLFKNNQVLAWASVSAAGVVVSSFGITGNPTHTTSSGTYTFTLTNATTGGCLLATPNTNDNANGWGVYAVQTSTTTVIVTTIKVPFAGSNSLGDQAFSFVLLGAP